MASGAELPRRRLRRKTTLVPRAKAKAPKKPTKASGELGTELDPKKLADQKRLASDGPADTSSSSSSSESSSSDGPADSSSSGESSSSSSTSSEEAIGGGEADDDPDPATSSSGPAVAASAAVVAMPTLPAPALPAPALEPPPPLPQVFHDRKTGKIHDHLGNYVGRVSLWKIGTPAECMSLYCSRHGCTMSKSVRTLQVGHDEIMRWFQEGMLIPKGKGSSQSLHKSKFPH